MPNIMKIFLNEKVLKAIEIMHNTCEERGTHRKKVTRRKRDREPKNEQEKAGREG